MSVIGELIGLCKRHKAGYRETMKYILATLISFVLFMVTGLAHAADPFTVVGVPVDATGSNAIEAQILAIQDGQLRAAEAVINRLTLAAERQAKTLPPLDMATVEKMIRALEIANEKRSADRYLGDITVAFNPSQIQSYLKANGLNMISTQARTRLVLPILDGYPLWEMNPWSMVWQDGRYSHALTPIKVAPLGEGDDSLMNSAEAAALDMDALKRLGQRFGADQILVVRSASGVSAEVTDIALDTGLKRNIGYVSGEDYSALAAAIVSELESGWKQASVSLAENAVVMTVSVLYDTHNEWLGLKDAINGSAQIQDARLDALSKDGALMTLTYGGDMGRLRNELSFKGVDVRNDSKIGVVLSRSGRF